MEFLSLLKINNIYIIQVLFLINFLIVFLISYPIGYLIGGNKNSKNLFYCSTISISIGAIIVAIILNFVAVLAKYLIISFFFFNLIIIYNNKNILYVFFEEIKKNKVFLLNVSLVYFLILNIVYPIYLESNFIEIPYDRHLIYYFAPIQEILNANYFSRIRVTSLYPMEWATFHFFQAAFNSIYLNFLGNFGYLGLLFLKCFFSALIYCSLLYFIFKNVKFREKEKVLEILLIFNFIFCLLLVSNLNWLIFGNGTIVAFSIYFILKNLFQNNSSTNIILSILLVMGSFKNVLISSFIYYYFSVKNLKHVLFLKIKLLGINTKHLFLILLLFIYLSTTFLSGKNIFGKFHILGNYGMWESTFTYKIINNDFIFFTVFSVLILIKILAIKNYNLIKKKMKFENFYLIFLLIIIPFASSIILLSKGLIYNSVDNSHLKIYLNSFTLENLKFYFFVPFLWFLLLGDTNKRFKLFLITLITVHTGLSIFIHNHIILPAYYTLEIIFLFWIFYIFFKNKSKFFSKIQILIVLFLINSTFFISYNNIFPNSILIKLDDLSKFKNISYICPNDLKKFTDYEDIVESDLLSGLLNKRYYTNLSYDKNYNFYNYFHLATPLAIPPSIKFNNPCRN